MAEITPLPIAWQRFPKVRLGKTLSVRSWARFGETISVEDHLQADHRISRLLLEGETLHIHISTKHHQNQHTIERHV